MAYIDAATAAKNIRADIKAAQKSGRIPAGFKFSVTSQRYSGAQRVTVTITDLQGVLFNPAWLVLYSLNPRAVSPLTPKYQPEVDAALNVADELASAYRDDRSDSSRDYFDCNFYLHVGVNWELERDRRTFETSAALAA